MCKVMEDMRNEAEQGWSREGRTENDCHGVIDNMYRCNGNSRIYQ